MTSLNFGQTDYKQFSINQFTGGTCTNPIRPQDASLLYNFMVRSDGRLVPRGTVFELQCPSSIISSASFQIDNIVNNTGGPVSNAETPYFFFVGNYPSSGNLSLWNVEHPGASQSINFLGNTTSTGLSNPSLPSYTWAADINGLPWFLFCNWTGTGDDNLWEWNGTALTSVSSSPPAAQAMLGFTSTAVLIGGGSLSGSISLRNQLYWSTANSLVSFPATQFTVPFVQKGLALQDFTVTNSRPIITTNCSFLSLNGDASGFIAVEIGSVEDILLKNTLASTGTIPYCAGKNGIYILGEKISDVTEPIKGIYYPITYTYGVNNEGIKAGYASFSTNGLFYGAYNQNPTSGTLITNMPIVHTPNELSIFLVYDTYFHCWYYWGYEFTIKGVCSMDPNAFQISTNSNTFITGFAFTGVSPAGNNALYFSESSGSGGQDTVDTVAVNYNTGFVSGPIDFGSGDCLHHIGGFTIIGTTSGASELIVQGCTTGRVYAAVDVEFNTFIPLDIDVDEPIRICFNGDSQIKEIESFEIYYEVLVRELELA
jgi:hypothetical protein